MTIPAEPKKAGEMATTPGPWHVRRGVCGNDHPDTSADVYGLQDQFVADCGCHEQANANASLIAAAPDLLAALKGLRGLIVGECVVSMYECVDGERADAAIQKAELGIVQVEDIRCVSCGTEVVPYKLVEWSDARCRSCWGTYLEAYREGTEERDAILKTLPDLVTAARRALRTLTALGHGPSGNNVVKAPMVSLERMMAENKRTGILRLER